MQKLYLINREISWLSFNARVMQEAKDPATPLLERLKFLGIFSNNLDEFFRVRVATMRRMLASQKRFTADFDPKTVLENINREVLELQDEFERTFAELRKKLEVEHIYIVDEKGLSEEEVEYCETYFEEEVRAFLFPIMLDNVESLTNLTEQSIYLACVLARDSAKQAGYAIMELPTESISRFIVLPERTPGQHRLIMLDDVIRLNLPRMFRKFGYKAYTAYTFKFTRDSELDLDDDFELSFIENLSKSLKARKLGNPVRFIHDAAMPSALLQIILKKIQFNEEDPVIAGGRYHNFKDFMKFPDLGRDDLLSKHSEALPVPEFEQNTTVIDALKNNDVMVHYPYNSFDYFIEFLREASIDPRVTSIKLTAYRLATNSKVANALINGAKNGKKVTVYLELRARFDEAANIKWANHFKEAGIRVLFGIPHQKVHNKFCLVKRREKNGSRYYLHISTGNFNESTARIYCDDALFTGNQVIAKEIVKVTKYLEGKQPLGYFKNLLVSPYNLRSRLLRFIRAETKAAAEGKKARIILKLNNLSDTNIIRALYRASEAGVKIDLIIRGICCILPGQPYSENIRIISIVDAYLEHSRIYYFYNGGNERYYISSADWMFRNFDMRVEIAVPIVEKHLQKRLYDMLELQLNDNTKARILNQSMDNRYVQKPDESVPDIRTQKEMYRLIVKESGEPGEPGKNAENTMEKSS